MANKIIIDDSKIFAGIYSERFLKEYDNKKKSLTAAFKATDDYMRENHGVMMIPGKNLKKWKILDSGKAVATKMRSTRKN